MQACAKKWNRLLHLSSLVLTFLVSFAAALTLLNFLTPACAAQAQPQSVVQHSPSIAAALHHDLSAPLFLLPPAPRQPGMRVHSVKPLPFRFSGPGVDPVVQDSDYRILAPLPILNFSGIGQGFTGPAGTFTVHNAPPDTNGDVGPNHYVQIVNLDLAIFNKTGTPILGPIPINTLWSGFGGACEIRNDGDPIALYDPLADRWVISELQHSILPYLECVAVSQTPDPTGAYFRYSFDYGNVDFPDYPKMAVWPDAYYTTYNIFANGQFFTGPKVCAFNRANMLVGAAATQQCFDITGTLFGGLLASDLIGATPPPAGSPNYIVGLGATNTTLSAWKFHVDWVTPANTTLTGPSDITVAPYFNYYCADVRGACIPQLGVGYPLLETLSNRIMHRLAYRNLSGHEALVVTHSVVLGSGAAQSGGVRWYELRPAAGVLTVFQQGTYAPDSNYRWMPSGAMDKDGNIAIGFSVSSINIHPQIHYAGHLVTDPPGIMGQGEGTIIDGGGSQTFTRWGDYSSMSVDPTDGCTFWYTNEYLAVDGAFNWKTQIATFKFPGCGLTVASDFSISANPISLNLTTGASGTSAISTALVSGSAETITLTVAGLPGGASASLTPTSVTTGNGSTLTVNAGTAAPGTYLLTVKGVSSSATHSTAVTLNVTSTVIVNGGFETGNLSGWIPRGTAAVVAGSYTGSFAVRLGAATATNGGSAITQTFTVPAAGGTLSFYYQVHCSDTVNHDWAAVTLKNNVSGVFSSVLPRTCTNAGTWVHGTFSLAGLAGKSVSLNLINRDDNGAASPTFTLFDDVAVQ